jgi:hypothetical protein
MNDDPEDTSGDPVEPPSITQALLDYLDQVCPNTCPELNWPERKVWAEVGKRELIDRLKALYRMQREERQSERGRPFPTAKRH